MFAMRERSRLLLIVREKRSKAESLFEYGTVEGSSRASELK